MILVNFKIYQETFGDKAIELAKIIKDISEKNKIRIVITATALDAWRIQKETGAEVWLQNVDEYDEGKHSGWVSMKQAMALGIKGSLINHFEHQGKKGTILKIIKNRPKGFELMCCVKTVGQIEKWVAKAKPDYILYEPPELIGSSDKSVATENPQSIKKAVELSKGIPLMIGAGIKNKQDVVVSLKMGAKAIGLASGLVLSENQGEVLEEIVAGFNVII